MEDIAHYKILCKKHNPSFQGYYDTNLGLKFFNGLHWYDDIMAQVKILYPKYWFKPENYTEGSGNSLREILR